MASSFLEPSHDVAGRLLSWVDASTADAVSTATPLVLAGRDELVATSHMFLGSVSGSAGETSALLILLGGGFLLLTRVANWRTVLATIASFFALTTVLLAVDKISYQSMPGVFGPAIWHLFAGGLLFGAFYMATDPVTSPTTNAAKWMYGIVIGSTTVLIRNFTGYTEGVTFAILLGNIMAPIFDEIIISIRIRRLRSEG
jgi:Na+-translocating ferredoxin:NAD+ oxidoreductase RnfD subunit